MPAGAARLSIAAIAAAAALLQIHMLLHAPAMATPDTFTGSFFVRAVVLANSTSILGAPGFTRFTLLLAAFTGVAAAGLALTIVLRSGHSATNRTLALALALASWSAAWFFVVTAHPEYLHLLMFDRWLWWRGLGDASGYAAGLLAPLYLLRFFIAYPRRPLPGDFEQYVEKLRDAQVAALSSGWRRRIYPAAAGQRRELRVSFTGIAWMIARAGHPVLVPFLVLLAAALAVVDAMGPRTLQTAGFQVAALALILPMTLVFETLRFHHRNAIASDREKIDWIYGTVFVGGVLWAASGPLWWLLLWLGLPAIEAHGAFVLPTVIFVAPSITTLQLYLLAILLALALSIFYRGSVDPPMAIGRVTLVGAMSFALALVFLLAERTLALLAAEWLQLPTQAGLMLSATVAAATFAPVRTRCEQASNRLVLNFLPLESLVGGERRHASVVICDLSGYTALSAIDERGAMLAATLLQKLAAQQCERQGGRVVKTMGDAVLLVFDRADGALAVLEALHTAFPAAAVQLGIRPLPLHSGAHMGELTVSADGDLYGQVVNIAARLQSRAGTGDAVVSRILAESARWPQARLQPLGALALKNVPEPVDAMALRLAEDSWTASVEGAVASC